MENNNRPNKQYQLIYDELTKIWERCRQEVERPSQALCPFLNEITSRLVDIGVPGIDIDFVMACINRKFDDTCNKNSCSSNVEDEWIDADMLPVAKGQPIIEQETSDEDKFRIKEKDPDTTNQYDELFKSLFQ